MRVLRGILACLLSLGVAFQGHAGTGAMQPSCPMAQASHHAPGAAHGPASDAHAMAGMGHAPQHESPPHDCGGGELDHCPCTPGCQGTVITSTAPRRVLQLTVAHAPAPPMPSFRSHADLRHWRPPALPA